MSRYLAHVQQDEQEQWQEHSLESHLRDVAVLAADFAKHFNSESWATLAGLWHDLGKYRPAFQSYIKQASGYDPEAHMEQGKGRVDHSTAGALNALEYNPQVGRFLAYLIAGHHAGLPDWSSNTGGQAALAVRIDVGRGKGYLDEALCADIPEDILHPQVKLGAIPGGSDGLHLWLRLLFSCLVDADFLDTEAFMDKEKSSARGHEWDIAELKACFDAYMLELSKGSKDTVVNRCRAEILHDCRTAAVGEPGIYTLTVPTGGGKTLSAMAFALEHAQQFNKQRVIVAIPYTSIIEQTAEQYRKIFGDAVLEHHSNLDPDQAQKENARSRLAAENWDSPIVVTTNVQLLESLFAARTSRCRKLHHLVNAVIVLDEAQLLPPEFLQPVLDVLRLLTEHYGVTLVLSTATQPSLGSVKDPFGKTTLRGLDAKQEIIRDVDSLFERLNRVSVTIPKDLNQRRCWEEIAAEVKNYEQVLVIVNSRRDARALHALMPVGTVHLSAQMCGEHRSQTIRHIKQELSAGKPIHVVSTQLVEAGVDLDFPVVYRALAGLDSIAQAAGRCNREGLLQQGQVVVFVPPKSPAQGLLLYGEQATRSIWHAGESDPLSHHLFTPYFRQYFSQEDADKHQIMPLLTKNARQGIVEFRTAAQRFTLIEETGQSLLVPFDNKAEALIQRLKYEGSQRYLLRQLQRYSVTVYEQAFHQLRLLDVVRELQPGIWVVHDPTAYDSVLGLLNAEDINCIRPEDYNV